MTQVLFHKCVNYDHPDSVVLRRTVCGDFD